MTNEERKKKCYKNRIISLFLININIFPSPALEHSSVLSKVAFLLMDGRINFYQETHC